MKVQQKFFHLWRYDFYSILYWQTKFVICGIVRAFLSHFSRNLNVLRFRLCIWEVPLIDIITGIKTFFELVGGIFIQSISVSVGHSLRAFFRFFSFYWLQCFFSFLTGCLLGNEAFPCLLFLKRSLSLIVHVRCLHQPSTSCVVLTSRTIS